MDTKRLDELARKLAELELELGAAAPPKKRAKKATKKKAAAKDNASRH